MLHQPNHAPWETFPPLIAPRSIGLVPDPAEERILKEDPTAKEEPLVITDAISRDFRHVLSGLDPGAFSRTVAEAKERKQQAYHQEVR